MLARPPIFAHRRPKAATAVSIPPLGACPAARGPVGPGPRRASKERRRLIKILLVIGLLVLLLGGGAKRVVRSEEHTSELQSLLRISYAVFCLKKKNTKHNREINNQVSSNTNVKYNY